MFINAATPQMENKMVTTIDMTKVIQDKSGNQLAALADKIAEESSHVMAEVSICLVSLAEELRNKASQASDVPVDSLTEHPKRGLVNFLRSEADHMDHLAHAVLTVPTDSRDLYVEFRDMMMRSVYIAEDAARREPTGSPTWTPESVRLMIDERARGLAQAYTGRIMPEMLK